MSNQLMSIHFPSCTALRRWYQRSLDFTEFWFWWTCLSPRSQHESRGRLAAFSCRTKHIKEGVFLWPLTSRVNCLVLSQLKCHSETQGDLCFHHFLETHLTIKCNDWSSEPECVRTHFSVWVTHKAVRSTVTLHSLDLKLFVRGHREYCEISVKGVLTPEKKELWGNFSILFMDFRKLNLNIWQQIIDKNTHKLVFRIE